MKKLNWFCLFLVFFIAFALKNALADNTSASGLPLPRFVSLRSSQVNLRSGPGIRYPVEWVYLKRALPVEIIAEFDNWRLIRDWEGTEGWIHQSMLSGRRMIRVTGVERDLRRLPSDDSILVAKVESGVIGRLLQCPQGSIFCRAEINGYHGWLKKGEFWGVYPGERID